MVGMVWPRQRVRAATSSTGGLLATTALLVAVIVSASQAKTNEVVTNDWYVQLHGNPGQDIAKVVAKRNGFSYVSPVSIFSTPPPSPLTISLSLSLSLSLYQFIFYVCGVSICMSAYVRACSWSK